MNLPINYALVAYYTTNCVGDAGYSIVEEALFKKQYSISNSQRLNGNSSSVLIARGLNLVRTAKPYLKQ